MVFLKGGGALIAAEICRFNCPLADYVGTFWGSKMRVLLSPCRLWFRRFWGVICGLHRPLADYVGISWDVTCRFYHPLADYVGLSWDVKCRFYYFLADYVGTIVNNCRMSLAGSWPFPDRLGKKSRCLRLSGFGV